MGKKVKVRVLYPTALAGAPEGGSVIEVDEDEAKGLVQEGSVELVRPKPSVESASVEAPEAAVRPRAQARKER